MVQSTMPPAASADAGAPSKAQKFPKKSARTRAREFALQGLYQHLVGKNPAEDIDHFTRDLMGFNKADAVHFDALLHGCIAQAAVLDAHIAQKVDRPLADLSPIEHAVLWIGTYEMLHCADVPWRAVLNECIELAKEFGGTDGHKYVNAVLNGLAPMLRPDEVRAHRTAPAAS
jgi:N utilization substance protein B